MLVWRLGAACASSLFDVNLLPPSFPWECWEKALVVGRGFDARLPPEFFRDYGAPASRLAGPEAPKRFCLGLVQGSLGTVAVRAERKTLAPENWGGRVLVG